MGLRPAVMDKPIVPEGVSHDVDLSGMTPGQRQRHHTKELRSIAFYHGKEGADAYRRRHPEARLIRVNVNALAYAPKPAGYTDTAASMVSLWFDSDEALAATNKADVEQLNAKMETDRFDPRNHFSKPMPPGLRRRVAELFERRGASLPQSAKSLSAVRRVIKGFKAGILPAATPFGGLGSRTGDTLAIGQRTFPIVLHGSRECIRVTAGGKTQRIALDIVEAILSGLPGGIAGRNSPLTTTCSIGELVHGPEIAPTDPLADTISGRTCPAQTASEQSPVELVHGADDPPTLSDRIRALRGPAAPPPAPAATNRDPLELDPDDT